MRFPWIIQHGFSWSWRNGKAQRCACDVQGAEESSQALPKKRHLLTGTLDSLAKVKATHGKDSNVYKAASKLMAKGIGMVRVHQV